MRRYLALLLVGIASLVGSAAVARPASEYALQLLMNGSLTKIGTLTSTGTSVTNGTTATPFTVTGGSVVWVECDAAACVGPGSAASCTVTSSDFKPRVAATPDYRQFVLTNDDTSLAMVSVSGTVNCGVFQKK